MRSIFIPLALAALTFVNPVRALGGSDSSETPSLCSGCVATGGGGASWNTGPNSDIKVNVTLTSGICRYVAGAGCLERDCKATASVSWTNQTIGTVVTTTGGTLTFPTSTGDLSTPPMDVDCGGSVTFNVAVPGTANSATFSLSCSQCTESH